MWLKEDVSSQEGTTLKKVTLKYLYENVRVWKEKWNVKVSLKNIALLFKLHDYNTGKQNGDLLLEGQKYQQSINETFMRKLKEVDEKLNLIKGE